MRWVCRLIGHEWGESMLLIPALPVEGEIKGNHQLRCRRCGETVLCWYGHKVPNVGVSLLRHRFDFRPRHWKV